MLSVWDRVEKELRGGEDGSGQSIRMTVCRLRSNDSKGNTMGILVPHEVSNGLSYELGRDAVSFENVEFSDETTPTSSSLGIVKVEPKVEVKIEVKVEGNVEPAVLIPKSEPKVKEEPDIEFDF